MGLKLQIPIYNVRGLYFHIMLLQFFVLNVVYRTVYSNEMSRSLANFMSINKDGNITDETDIQANRRSDLMPISHEGWNHGWAHFDNHLRVPDFGYHDIHESDEHGERTEIESHPRHYTHYEPHYTHYEHPHDHHQHFVYHEPMHHGSHHHGHIPMMHHHGHHEEEEEGEESGDHHDYVNGEHEEGDWDVGGGYFQLEEHGSDVSVVALKKHGTKVHMSGGDFNVIRDPWRHHSLFAGLFHPHEMPGHGHLPMEQFHQHFTYIANDRAVNHHNYDHHVDFGHEFHDDGHHDEGHHDDGHHDEGHHDDGHHDEGHHDDGHHDDGHHDEGHKEEKQNSKEGDKREYSPNSAVTISLQGQTKQQILSRPDNQEIITIPLHIPGIKRNATNDAELTNENADTRSSKEDKNTHHDDDDDEHKYRKELPRVQSPHLEPLNGLKFGPKNQNTVIEIPLSPIFKRQLADANRKFRLKVKRSEGHDQLKNNLNRGSKLARAFLGKTFVARTNRIQSKMKH